MRFLFMKKKLVIGLTVGCAAIIACSTALAINHGRFLSTYADGILANGNDRTLVFDKDSNVTHPTSNTTSASVGSKMRLFGYETYSLEDGIFIGGSGLTYLAIYYDAFVDGFPTTYEGFNSATVTSISIEYQRNSSFTMSVCWGNLHQNDPDNIGPYGGAITTVNMPGVAVHNTVTIDSGDFFDNQADAKGSVYRCIYLKNIYDIRIYSITVNYTCL